MEKGILYLHFPVYETIWTGEVDQILGYDFDKKKILVKNTVTGKERSHMTSIDTFYLQTTAEPYAKNTFREKKNLLKGILNIGFPRRMINDRAGLLE